MKNFRAHTASAFALATLIAALHAAPASAMGHSGVSTSKPAPQAQDRPGQMGAEVQAQIEALRKEVTELRAHMDPSKGTASTK